jgi:hypothetical protein
MKVLTWRSALYRFGFALVCLIGLGALATGHADSPLLQSRTNGQDKPYEVQHQYVLESLWNGDGFIPYKGWEGCFSQTGEALKSDDGVQVYFVQEHCTSPGAASNEQLSRLAGTKEAAQQWQIIQTFPLDNALLVELLKPVQVGLNEPASSRWVCLWTQDASLFLIYSTDREHVLDYFRIRQKDQSKVAGKNGA